MNARKTSLLAAVDNLREVASQGSLKVSWEQWFGVLKAIFPLYIAIHLAFIVTTVLALLFTVKDFAPQSFPLYTLWQSWHHWDTGNYMGIAINGYHDKLQTVFFPLYPLLERSLMFFGIDPLVAGLVISDAAGLVLLATLYRLVQEDFDSERAFRTALYLSVFPTAFFLAAGYNESLFICLTLLYFYHVRRGHWWLAGLFGFFASLTRSAGILLLVPFCYEYLQEHEFRLRKIRLNALGGLLIPMGVGLYGLYCYYRFHNFLAFSDAQSYWTRSLHGPWHGIIGSFKAIIISGSILNFRSIRNVLDLAPDLLIMSLILLSFVGPWKFPKKLWVYSIYGAIVWLFLQLFPTGGVGFFPLESMSRYMLELFPAFIVLASIGGRFRALHLSYLMICSSILFFLLTQFLTGHWVL